LKCGKPAKFSFIKGWTKYEETVGEVGGWDSVEGEDIEIHLCKEHADLFGNDPNFRSQMVEMVDLQRC
jgi:hypothetical protein